MPFLLTPEMQNEIRQGRVKPITFVELDISDTVIRRLHSRAGDRTFLGETWQGVGEFGSITPLSQSTDLSSNGIRLTLNGASQSIIALMLGQRFQGRPAIIWQGFVDAQEEVIPDPMPWEYVIGEPSLKDNGTSVSVSLTCEAEVSLWNRPNEIRYTDEDHKKHWPDDDFFEYVEAMAEFEFIWPHAATLEEIAKK